MNHTYLRGDMFYVDLGYGIGSEQEGYRPIVIIQNDVGNRHSPTVIIASITSQKDDKRKLPTHYYLGAVEGLEYPSIVLLDQIRTIDKRRLKEYIVHLPETHIQGIEHALAVSIGLIKKLPPKLNLRLFTTCAEHFCGAGVFSLKKIKEDPVKNVTCDFCRNTGRKIFSCEVAER